jgi:IS30 family transposase
MSYSTNPYAPRARREAINLVLLHGFTAASAARKTGVHRATIGRWLARPEANDQRKLLPTHSSRPHSHPATIPETVTQRILELRWQLKRCAEVIHAILCREGLLVSLATVGRVLARHAQTVSLYGRKGKTVRRHMPRPKVEAPGSFVEMDTIHFSNWKTKQKYFVYTLIDLKSRWSYAEYSPRISPEETSAFVERARKAAPFSISLIQTDNGQEFSRACERSLTRFGITQRRIRLGKKNDNAQLSALTERSKTSVLDVGQLSLASKNA